MYENNWDYGCVWILQNWVWGWWRVITIIVTTIVGSWKEPYDDDDDYHEKAGEMNEDVQLLMREASWLDRCCEPVRDAIWKRRSRSAVALDTDACAAPAASGHMHSRWYRLPYDNFPRETVPYEMLSFSVERALDWPLHRENFSERVRHMRIALCGLAASTRHSRRERA